MTSPNYKNVWSLKPSGAPFGNVITFGKPQEPQYEEK